MSARSPPGESAIEEIERLRPQLVLLDITMPGMQGDEVLHIVRQKFNAVELPIIMTTAQSEGSKVVEFLKLGANDYIIKPIDFDVAAMRINTHIHLAELSREMAKLRELEAVTSMIQTYNHEINNPLAIALGTLKAMQDHEFEKPLEKLEAALWRIADIVKKISQVTSRQGVQYDPVNRRVKI